MSKDFTPFDESPIKGVHHRWTVLAALADYLDAGAIVAGAASLTYWISYFHLSSILTGLIAAFSPNAFGAAIGALLAGPLGDRFGRKAIYMYDMIVYFIGALLVSISFNVIMLIVGYTIVGIAVGVDVPTSWSLITEYSPKRGRGKLMSYTNLFWYIGPIIILLLGIITLPVGINSFRVLFGSLALVAIITWALRRGIPESPRWAVIKGKAEEVKKALDQLGASQISAQNVSSTTIPKKIPLSRFKKGFAFLIPINVLWAIPAGTFGFFLPFLIEDLGAKGVITGNLIQILWFITAIIGVVAVAMQISDKVSRRLLYTISAVICAISFAIPIALPFTVLAVAATNVILFGFGHGIGLWPIKRVWTAELFPTEVRATGQAIAWSMERFALGFWSLFVPAIIASTGYSVIAAVGTTFFIVQAILGGLYGPESQGKSLEQVLREFYGEDIFK